jgi:predicted nucleotidyltransferase
MSGSGIMNLEKLQPEVKKKFVPYLETMLKTHGDNVVSVFVYGSAASGTYIKGISDINSAIVFRELKFPVLKKSLKIVSKGISASISAPLFLTREYISSSLDVFPIEFMDMKENHVLVYGEDILSGIAVRGEHTRLFCEQQLKGKLVRIREAYLEVGLSRKGMVSLLKESLNSLIPVFGNLIRLKGEVSPADKTGIIESLSAIFGLDGEMLLHIHRSSAKQEKIISGEEDGLIDSFISEVEKLSIAVDKL